MDELPKFRLGNYRHYKGGTYSALALVTHHETRQVMVLYVSHKTGELTVRPLKKMEIVGGVDTDAWNDWIEHEGEKVRRFAFLGPAPSVDAAKSDSKCICPFGVLRGDCPIHGGLVPY